VPRPQTVEMMKGRLELFPTTVEDAFEFRKDRGWRWLQRLCFWVLKKIGAHRHITVEKVSYGPFDNAQIGGRVFEIVESTIGWRNFDASEWMLVMGRDAYRELVNDRELFHAFGFIKTLEVRHGPSNPVGPYFDYVRGQVYGIDIMVVPWVNGMALVPNMSLAYSGRGYHVADCADNAVSAEPMRTLS